MLILNISKSVIAKAQLNNTITTNQIINLYEQHMDDIQLNGNKANKQIRNNIISALLTIGIEQQYITFIIYELDLTDLLKHNTVKQINNMFTLQ